MHMTHKDSILLKTLRKEHTSRPPVWFMRQAGRILPRYLALKEKYTFREMMENPKIAAEVTLMPITDLGVDAAILFSDILVIPQALGMDLHFPDSGPLFSTPLISSKKPSQLLSADASKLEYIYAVIDEIIAQKSSHIPLIGFCGSPFTVLLYMLQGLHRKSDFPDAIQFIYQNKRETKKIVEIITELSIEYMRAQIAHGIDMFQLFDTHAGLLPFELYQELILPHVTRFAQEARNTHTPFVFFPKGIGLGFQQITPEHADFVSVDWQTPLSLARTMLHADIGIQGNIDPRMLYSSELELHEYLETYKQFGTKHNDWICNLGHGFMPGLPLERAQQIVQWIKNTDWTEG
ncbi:MAG: uroporphyrinogen decarboxylase [Bacteroidales bacterium]|nr:uroporphyrinogen decarboxylase [Bacteroidales bacterium]